MSLSTFLAENGYEASAVFVALGLNPFLVDRVNAGEQLLPAGVCAEIARYTGTDLGSVVAASGGAVTAPAVATNAPTYFTDVGGLKAYPVAPVNVVRQVNPASAQPLPSASSQVQAMIVARTVPSP
jgi:hypothetical protein